MKSPKEIFEEGSLLNRDYKGHEQMLMNEGTFIALFEKYTSGSFNESDIQIVARKIYDWAQEDDTTDTNLNFFQKVEKEIKNLPSRFMPKQNKA